MKKYIGTKQIEAEPMTMGEAYEKGLLRANRQPDADYAKYIGYHVKYKDGYESWSPKDVFEEAYQCSESFLDRLKIEYNELYAKFEKCAIFVDSEKFRDTIKDDYPAFLLSLQRVLMGYYLQTLQCRMEVVEPLETGIKHIKRMSLGIAVEALKFGFAIRRAGWNGKGLVVFKQIPAHITEEIVPKMQSLPKSAKDIILKGKRFIDYTSQCLIYNENTGRADSWVPSISDVFAEDWEIVLE